MSSNNGKVRYRGVAFEYGDDWRIIPELTCDQARELTADIDQVQAPIPESVLEGLREPATYAAHREQMRQRRESAVRVITAALRNNYPGMTDAEISSFVTVGLWAKMFNAAMGLTDDQKVRDAGELRPVDSGPKSTGTSSTGV